MTNEISEILGIANDNDSWLPYSRASLGRLIVTLYIVPTALLIGTFLAVLASLLSTPSIFIGSLIFIFMFGFYAYIFVWSAHIDNVGAADIGGGYAQYTSYHCPNCNHRITGEDLPVRGRIFTCQKCGTSIHNPDGISVYGAENLRGVSTSSSLKDQIIGLIIFIPVGVGGFFLASDVDLTSFGFWIGVAMMLFSGFVVTGSFIPEKRIKQASVIILPTAFIIVGISGFFLASDVDLTSFGFWIGVAMMLFSGFMVTGFFIPEKR